jgi:hypothetical protein
VTCLRSFGQQRPSTTPRSAIPQARALTDPVGELATRSDEFRTRWARYDVRYDDTGKKRVHHPIVGDLELAFEVMTRRPAWATASCIG